MSAPSYWLSASVLTITSAPSLSPASRPAWKAAARPLWLVRRTTWSTPCARATSIVRSVEPSSMISHSTTSNPSTCRGRWLEGQRKLLFLVETRNLDDELHGLESRSRSGNRARSRTRSVPCGRSYRPHGSGILVRRTWTRRPSPRPGPAPMRPPLVAGPRRLGSAAAGGARARRAPRACTGRRSPRAARSRFLLRLWGIKQGLPVQLQRR